MIITLILAAAFNGLQVRSEKTEWDPFENGKCYRSHDKSIDIPQWLWIAGIGFYAAVLIPQLTKQGRAWANCITTGFQFLCKWLGKLCVYRADKVFDLSKNLPTTRPYKEIINLVCECFYLTALTVALGTIWCFVQFTAI